MYGQSKRAIDRMIAADLEWLVDSSKLIILA